MFKLNADQMPIRFTPNIDDMAFEPLRQKGVEFTINSHFRAHMELIFTTNKHPAT
ncbi:Uncharacterised protein [Vibrio cholerae]|nr:Uncharacterised protein [Vibrio cholerae]